MSLDSRTPSPVAIFDNYWATTLAFASSLGGRSIPLHFYGEGAGRWSRYCIRRASCPAVEDSAAFLPWLRNKVRSGEIERVAPTTDLIAYYLSVLREEFPADVQRAILPLQELEDSVIKTRFAEVCARTDVPTPLSFAPDDPSGLSASAERIGFPMIVKPKSHLAVGFAERGCLVRNMAELRAAYRPYPVAVGQEAIAAQYPELRWPFLQQYIPSARKRVFSVSGAKDADGGVVAALVSYKRRQWPPETGISTSQVSCNDERILAAGLAAVDQVISRGIFEIELLASGTELLAIDLNPRAFGFMALDIALGNDLPWLWYQSTVKSLVLAPLLPPSSIVEARLCIPHMIGRGVAWLFGVKSEKSNHRAEPPPIQRSIPMLGSWNDPIPMLLSNMRLLRHPGSLVRPYVKRARSKKQGL